MERGLALAVPFNFLWPSSQVPTTTYSSAKFSLMLDNKYLKSKVYSLKYSIRFGSVRLADNAKTIEQWPN